MAPLYLAIAALFILVSVVAQLPQALSVVATGHTAGIEEVGGVALRIVRDLLFASLALISFALAFRRGRAAYWRASFAVFLVLLFAIYSARAYLGLSDPLGAIIGNARVFMAMMVALGAGVVIGSMRSAAPARWLLLVVLVAAFIQIVLGTWHVVAGTGAEWARTWIGYKPIGGFGSYNSFASFCTVSAVFLTECLRRVPLGKTSRVVVVMTIVGLAVMVIASGSRGSMLALAVYLALEVLLPSRNRLGYAVTIGPPLLVLVVLAISNPAVTGRDVDIEREGRWVVWTQMFDLVGESSDLVVGAASGAYTAAAGSISRSDDGPDWANPHGVPILLLVNYGAVVFFILATAFLIRYFPVMLANPGTFAAIVILGLPYALLEMSPLNVLAFLSLEMARRGRMLPGGSGRRLSAGGTGGLPGRSPTVGPA